MSAVKKKKKKTLNSGCRELHDKGKQIQWSCCMSTVQSKSSFIYNLIWIQIKKIKEFQTLVCVTAVPLAEVIAVFTFYACRICSRVNSSQWSDISWYLFKVEQLAVIFISVWSPETKNCVSVTLEWALNIAFYSSPEGTNQPLAPESSCCVGWGKGISFRCQRSHTPLGKKVRSFSKMSNHHFKVEQVTASGQFQGNKTAFSFSPHTSRQLSFFALR